MTPVGDAMRRRARVPAAAAVARAALLRGAEDPQRGGARRARPRGARRRRARAPLAQLARLARRCRRCAARAGARLPRRERAPRPLLGHAPPVRGADGDAEQRRVRDRSASPQYVRFLQGDTRNLPQRPILITFDDGRLDSYRGADKILAEHGFKATMFVIAGFVEERNSFYLNWDELRRMATSGRWDLQEHAGVGHVNVRYDASGTRAPPTPTGSTGGRRPRELRGVQRRVHRRHPVGQAHDVRAAARLRALELRRAVRRLRPGPDQ